MLGAMWGMFAARRATSRAQTPALIERDDVGAA